MPVSIRFVPERRLAVSYLTCGGVQAHRNWFYIQVIVAKAVTQGIPAVGVHGAHMQAVEGWPGKTSVADTLWEYAQQNTPKKNTADYTQAIMDLGATLCTRSNPNCVDCPLNADCVALHEDRTDGACR